jgi:hypothetical protein
MQWKVYLCKYLKVAFVPACLKLAHSSSRLGYVADCALTDFISECKSKNVSPAVAFYIGGSCYYNPSSFGKTEQTANTTCAATIAGSGLENGSYFHMHSCTAQYLNAGRVAIIGRPQIYSSLKSYCAAVGFCCWLSVITTQVTVYGSGNNRAQMRRLYVRCSLRKCVELEMDRHDDGRRLQQPGHSTRPAHLD